MRGELAAELARLESERLTGVLRTGDGAFHLIEGVVAGADCRRTPGLDRMVIEAGVATAADWQRAGLGDPGHVLERPRLEALAVLSIFDAAYFLLSAPSLAEFQPAPPHWLAGVCQVPPRALIHECARRGDPGPWSASLVDRAPVVPVRRTRCRRVVLTGGQAEILAAADARRSITAIAQDLGRTAYGCLVAVRELTAAGLIEPPAPHTPVVMTDSVITEPVVAPAVTGPVPLPRRRRGQATAVAPPAPLPVPELWEPVDRDILVRLRAALKELA
ncbi:hypothetical protein [Nocardia yamanashiensis]|uniref:hypothetical protein n=1 Tax=Nocardia yamanashiensis TaxID=209247 RepID=UPI000A71437D|nr:hypothetical protein [Nocardia yamanashiensis]